MSRYETAVFGKRPIPGLLCFTGKDGKRYYTTKHQNRWTSHGTDFELARAEHYKILSGGSPALDRKTVTVAQAFKQWSEGPLTKRCDADQKYAKGRFANHVTKAIGDIIVSKLSDAQLSDLSDALRNKKLAADTRAHILGDLRCMLKWCVGRYLDKSPWREGLMPTQRELTPKAPKRLSDAEVTQLLETLDEPYRFICRLMLNTGLRWGEACRAQSSDVERGHMLFVAVTKSGESRRVPLLNPVAEPGFYREVEGRIGGAVRLCPFSSSSSFNKTVKAKTGLKSFHVHKLRHTFAYRYLEQRGSILTLQKILGHSTIELTQRYAMLTDDNVREEAARLAGAR